VVQPLFILWRQVKFGDNGQIHKCHHLNYSIYAKICIRRSDDNVSERR
jgi:hypothetical protein